MAAIPLDENDAKLSEPIARATAGTEIILTRGEAPVAKTVALEAPKIKREPGAYRGKIIVGPEFFEPPPRTNSLFGSSVGEAAAGYACVPLVAGR
jgi:antitoxin (DNA-binding transcriptional repressor) of toxin-antitoxin stability system